MNAYLETNYRVHGNLDPSAGPYSFTLKIGQPSAALVIAMRSTKTHCAAFLSASNPMDEMLHMESNIQRAQTLMSDLRKRGLFFIPGSGQHPTSGRAPEPSMLALGADLRLAVILGTAYRQRAIVWCGADAVPQLHMLAQR